jgi:3'-5' exoribonuclease
LAKQFVKNLKIGNPVQSQFVVVDVQELAFSSPSRAGDSFLKLMLGDVSGSIKGIIWDRSMVTEPIRQDDVLLVSGEVKEYQGPQIIINYFEKIKRENINRAHFQRVAAREPVAMWEDLQQKIQRHVKNKYLLELLGQLFADEIILQKFLRAPAAKLIHHNYLGGLLEHTLEVVELCLKIAQLYPGKISVPLLVTGAIIHDVGKIEEYDQDSFTFQQTDKGRMLGHIIIGLGILREKIGKIPSFPEHLQLELEHMLVSHHGEREWGSPETPRTINAFALFHADLVSARLRQFLQVMGTSQGKPPSWTKYNRYLGRSVFTGWKDEGGPGD